MMTIKSKRGIGLIETLVVTLIVGAGVLGLSKLQNQLVYNANSAKQQNTANIIAESKMESLRDFNVINTTSGAKAYNDITSGSSTSTQGGTTYTVNWTVNPNNAVGYKNVTITVNWTDNHNKARSLTLNSNIASIDPGSSYSGTSGSTGNPNNGGGGYCH